MANMSALVKELREKTGAGILDCQNALKENELDVEKSIDFLRQKGLAAAAKKAGRETKEGRRCPGSNGSRCRPPPYR